MPPLKKVSLVRTCLLVALALPSSVFSAATSGTTPSAAKFTPNLVDNIDRPLRYRPEGADFVIENGTEFFNRPLYGGNTAFRVDGGDRPEFVLYLPGRGGNVRLGLQTPRGVKWLHEAQQIETRYRPGELIYQIRDPLLGPEGTLRVEAVAYHTAHGLCLRIEAVDIAGGIELVWAFGGVNGQRGRRDGDIGTETVPISQWFQLKPPFCRDNTIKPDDTGFTLTAKAATVQNISTSPAKVTVAPAEHWNDLPALLDPRTEQTPHPVALGRTELAAGKPLFLSFQQINKPTDSPELSTYAEVAREPRSTASRPAALVLGPAFSAGELSQRFAASREHFDSLRARVQVHTPDPFLDAAVGALNVAADAVWDDPQQAIMHGAIAWRTKLLGWRGPYALDALGWHDRARAHITYWAGRQNLDPVPTSTPPADENANLARNETGLHSNGDLSNSHYDMNLVFIDALFRHLRWTGDLALARQVWPMIERHLAWERRLFRREYGPEKLPLYEAYAAIWASDDLQYSGGGATHSTAYNYFHHREAARLARLLGMEAASLDQEADLIARALRVHLWMPERGMFAEYKDWLGLQRVHPSAAVWTYYHTIDSEVPDPTEAWLMSEYVKREVPHLPVHGPGVPEGVYTLATSNWMPYQWSINNVVMSEVMHTALAHWQAGRPEEAWKMTKGSLLAAMYMGITPGNVGSMSYLDVYRRESQRDFADGSGTTSRALVEGLFGLRPDALKGELLVAPGFPAEWRHASLQHPTVKLSFKRTDVADAWRDAYVIDQNFDRPLAVRLRLRAPRDQVQGVGLDGKSVSWKLVESGVGAPQIEIVAPAAARSELVVYWGGKSIAPASESTHTDTVAEDADDGPLRAQGQLRWKAGPRAPNAIPLPTLRRIEFGHSPQFDPVDLTPAYNDRVTQIFKNEYRSPRSPFVSLALPKQGIGGWAGGVNAQAEIDDLGLRTEAAKTNGLLRLPNGVPFRVPFRPDENNAAFVSRWDNYKPTLQVPLTGRARGLVLLMAGSTHAMHSQFENGEVVVTYADGSTETLPLVNPTTWWPIEQDYFLDDFQFRHPGPLPTRVDLKTGDMRVLELPEFKGKGRVIPGGAATVLELPLDAGRDLQSLTITATANDVVIGLLAATLARPAP